MRTYLEDIKERVERATEGPWGEHPLGGGGGILQRHQRGDLVVIQMTTNDADFVAHARQDIPALLSVVDELKKFLEEQNVKAIALMGGDGQPDAAYVKLDRLIPLKAALAPLLQPIDSPEVR